MIQCELNVITKVLLSERRKIKIREGLNMAQYRLGRWEKGPLAKEYTHRLETREGEQINSFLEPPEGKWFADPC